MIDFTEEQLERYSRHIILPEVGGKGQSELLRAKVFCLGAGGLGSPALLYLAAAGVGTIGVVDADEVDLSNLQRQIIHSTRTIGTPKVNSAKETIEGLNPDVKVVVSSGYSNDPIMSDYKKYGFKGVIAKPYKVAELSKVLHEVISGK